MADLRSRLPLQLPIGIVALFVVVGMVRVLTQHWRQGAVLIGGAMVIAALLRALLPDDRAGLLAVRSKVIDVACCAVAGVAMILVAVTITRDTFGA